MTRCVLKRILVSFITIVVIVLILFILMNLMPGTPFNDEKLTADQIAILYQKYGLDKPLLFRFWKYLLNITRGDFGVSYVIAKNMKISEMLRPRFFITIRIALLSVLIGCFCGIVFGTAAALNHKTFFDPIISFFSMIGASVPSYVFALVLIYFVAFRLKLLPILYTEKHLILSTIMPALALAFPTMANISRFTRTQMIDVLSSDYIILAEAKGIRRGALIIHHALRNAMIPLMTVIAPLLVGMMFGSTLMENIYSIPGIGSLFIQAIQVNDFNVVISLAFIYSVIYIIVMLLVDILYGVIDPRVRVG